MIFHEGPIGRGRVGFEPGRNINYYRIVRSGLEGGDVDFVFNEAEGKKILKMVEKSGKPLGGRAQDNLSFAGSMRLSGDFREEGEVILYNCRDSSLMNSNRIFQTPEPIGFGFKREL